jgi:hypothetical protein
VIVFEMFATIARSVAVIPAAVFFAVSPMPEISQNILARATSYRKDRRNPHSYVVVIFHEARTV